MAESIRRLKPAYVLIEGPADFNSRLDELTLSHQLPIAIYSYLSGDSQEGNVHHGSWSPFVEHSPEWQALSVGHEVGATLRFIDLPAWHDSFTNILNRYADSDGETQEHRAGEYMQGLAATLCVDERDAVWDTLFEDYTDLDILSSSLKTYFAHLRNDAPGSMGNQTREAMMANWIAWAMAQNQGLVLVVCGGYHAPPLERQWSMLSSQFESGSAEPLTPVPQSSALQNLRYGSFLVPYTFKRLDAFTGYASGMPSPAYYQWLWSYGPEGAAKRMLQGVMTHMREKKLPVSTADLMAVQVRARGLARLRGHHHPLRSDWLDALAGALVKGALDAPLPWSYRGPIRPGTDPVLLHVMDVLAGDQAGRLAPNTPQPPLVHALWSELEAAGIHVTPQPNTVELDQLTPQARERSQLLHRVALLELPGFVRNNGPQLAMSGELKERWTLSQPLEQQAALIEAGAWGATLLDAARAKLEDNLRRSGGRIEALAKCLNRAAFAGLHDLSQSVLTEMQTAVAHEPHFEALGSALGTLFALLRHGQLLGMAGAPVLEVIVEAGIDRALWLLEPPAVVPAAAVDAHIEGFIALRQIALDHLGTSHQQHANVPDTPPPLAIEVSRILAVMERKAASAASAPVSRGAALGMVISLRMHMAQDMHSSSEQALAVLGSLPSAQLGDVVSGLLALAREELLHDKQFVAGLNTQIQMLDDTDFVIALPALRGAFAWLPARERGNLAEQVLGLYQAQHLTRRSLTVNDSTWSPEEIARHRLAEQQALSHLASWGISCHVGDLS